nr:ABC transporter permease [Heyndrickxia oleronia]
MLTTQIWTDFKRAFTMKNILIWLFIILIVPVLSFYPIRKGYMFFNSIEVFQEMVGGIIPLIFPVLVIIIYLPNFLQEQKNNFITYTRPRIPVSIYILSKGIINAILTGFIIFSMMFFSYIFAVYIEPNYLHVIEYSQPIEGNYNSNVTFSQFMDYGTVTYTFVYSLWVTINGVVYTTIAFLLMLIIRLPFVALSAPFLFYHIFNFVVGVFGVARFSPVSTIFPFNIEQQQLWTVMVPFTFLIIVVCSLLFKVTRNREDWML